MDDKGERVPTDVKDKDDGTYEIKFTAHRPGTYCLKVSRRVLIQISVWHMNAQVKNSGVKAVITKDNFLKFEKKIVKWLNPEVHFVIWREKSRVFARTGSRFILRNFHVKSQSDAVLNSVN